MSLSVILLVPAMVAAVVLVAGFAGCAAFSAEANPPVTQPGPPLVVDPTPQRPSYRDTLLKDPGLGLVAYWTLSDTGGVVAFDRGPNAFHGTYVDSPPVTLGEPGGALSPREPDVAARFPGEGGHMRVDYHPLLNPGPSLQFSFEVWVKLRPADEVAGRSEFLASSRQFDGPDSSGWDLFVTYESSGARTFKARLYAGSGAANTQVDLIADSPVAPADAWRLVVMTYDGGTQTLALHIRIVGEASPFTKSTSGATFTNANGPNSPLRMGAGNQPLPGGFLHGSLDEAAFYNRALTPAQVDDHLKAALP